MDSSSKIILITILFSSLIVVSLANDPVSPNSFCILFNTTIKSTPTNSIIVNVTRSWAPIGSDHIYALVNSGFYNQAAFFRVVPNFVVQYGIAATPEENKKWVDPIKDDPVVKSNIAGTLSYAATSNPNSRTTQIFINYGDNSQLDRMGFAPFGVVTSGMNSALTIYNPTPGNTNGVNQQDYLSKGNAWILQQYPDINLITTATIIPDGKCPATA